VSGLRCRCARRCSLPPLQVVDTIRELGEHLHGGVPVGGGLLPGAGEERTLAASIVHEPPTSWRSFEKTRESSRRSKLVLSSGSTALELSTVPGFMMFGVFAAMVESCWWLRMVGCGNATWTPSPVNSSKQQINGGNRPERNAVHGDGFALSARSPQPPKLRGSSLPTAATAPTSCPLRASWHIMRQRPVLGEGCRSQKRRRTTIRSLGSWPFLKVVALAHWVSSSGSLPSSSASMANSFSRN